MENLKASLSLFACHNNLQSRSSLHARLCRNYKRNKNTFIIVLPYFLLNACSFYTEIQIHKWSKVWTYFLDWKYISLDQKIFWSEGVCLNAWNGFCRYLCRNFLTKLKCLELNQIQFNYTIGWSNKLIALVMLVWMDKMNEPKTYICYETLLNNRVNENRAYVRINEAQICVQCHSSININMTWVRL